MRRQTTKTEHQRGNPNHRLPRKGLLPMRNWIKALAVTSAIATGLVAAPALYAVESAGAEGQMMGNSLMGEGGMMGMMQQISKRMEGVGKMTQSPAPGGDRERVVSGKSVSVRADYGVSVIR